MLLVVKASCHLAWQKNLSQTGVVSAGGHRVSLVLQATQQLLLEHSEPTMFVPALVARLEK